jgi:hypothetical protein
MFTKKIVSTVIVSALTGGISAPSHAFEGGGGGGGGEVPTFMTMTNPDGSSVTVTRTRKGRKIVKNDRNGNREVRRVPRKGGSWAHNHTTGTTSIGVQPGVRIVIDPLGIGLSF